MTKKKAPKNKKESKKPVVKVVKAPQTPPKKRGRPPKDKVIPDFVRALGTNAKVEPIELSQIDLEDKTYQFRVNLRVGDLVESLTTNGQQVPAILRRVKGRDRLQIVSGFRRITAIARIGWASVNAIVLDNLSDEDAWKTSVLENTARRTYSDLDRAYAIVAYHKLGHTMEDIGQTVFKLSRKQATRLKSLVDLPKVVQDAIADGRLTTTHALVLKQLADKLGSVDYKECIGWVAKDGLSVGKLRAAVLEAHQDGAEKPMTLFVRLKDKKLNREVVRFRPVRIDPKALTAGQKKAMLASLKELADEFGG